MRSEAFVSVVILVDAIRMSIDNSLKDIQCELDKRYSDYEIVVVVQGPVLEESPSDDIEKILSTLPSIRYIQLSGSVSNDVAWGAGLENAIGDFVILFDYLNDPVCLISKSVDKCKSGYDVVIGVANQPTTITYTAFRDFAGKLLSAIDYHLPKNSTGFRCLSRRAVNSVTATGRFHHQFYLRIQKTGYPSCAITYDVEPKSSEKKTFPRGMQQLLNLLVFNSSRPLRWMSALGLFGSSAAFIFAVYSIFVHLISGSIVEGWTTTILFMSMLFMLQFIMLAFFGEYIGRLLDDRDECANYSVVFEKNSVVMVNEDRFNVIDSSAQSSINKVQTGRDR